MKIKFRSSASRRSISGQGMVEYALLLGLIALAVIGIVSALGPLVGQAFNSAKEGVSTEHPANYSIQDPDAIPGNLPPLAPVYPSPAPTPTPSASLLDSNTGITFVLAYVPLFAEPPL